jgi:hypothetical protein
MYVFAGVVFGGVSDRFRYEKHRVNFLLPGQARNNFYEINKINRLQDKHDGTL